MPYGEVDVSITIGLLSLLSTKKELHPLNATGTNMHQILPLTDNNGIERVKNQQLNCNFNTTVNILKRNQIGRKQFTM